MIISETTSVMINIKTISIPFYVTTIDWKTKINSAPEKGDDYFVS